MVVGSSPTSATRPVGQAAKTPPFHGGNTSSILVRVTNNKSTSFEVLFVILESIESELREFARKLAMVCGKPNSILAQIESAHRSSDSRTDHQKEKELSQNSKRKNEAALF